MTQLLPRLVTWLMARVMTLLCRHLRECTETLATAPGVSPLTAT
jgi:hypothetical protein